MRVSERWLREWINPNLSLDQICEQLTNAGLEVDSVSQIGPEFSGVDVGEITSVSKHPRSDHLTICTVDSGRGNFNVVCGAPNARRGMKSAYARVGAEVAGNVLVEKASIQGVDSEGMLCSGKELGINEDHSGILELNSDAQIGRSVADELELHDHCIELDLTPNRGDCFSVCGIARELAAINDQQLKVPSVGASKTTSDARIPITLDAPDGCPIYLGRIIENVNVNARVPHWMIRKLHAAGIRPINAIVDVLNYVMLELGQPMHAFDLDHVREGIVVRYANAGEKLMLLDGSEAELDSEVLAITSGDAPVAIAGVIGGLNSGVSLATQHVLLECAFFAPEAIFGTARKYGLQTDASTRYERGVDYALQDLAMERATTLILDIAGGSAGPTVNSRSPRHLPQTEKLSIHKERLDQLIGEHISDEVVYGIFERLGFEPEEPAEDWTVISPTHRFDINIEEDLVEEVCRIYGYDRIGARLPATPLNLEPAKSALGDSTDLRVRLCSLGYNETITYSFIDRTRYAHFTESDESPTLQNPMSSDREVMRCSLLPGLLDVVAYNVARQHDLVRLFEHGQCFQFSNGELIQKDHLAAVAWGMRHPEGWANDRERFDFFDMKGHVEELLPQGTIEFRQATKSWFQPGNAADVFVDGIEIGSVGQIHPDAQSTFDVEGPIFAFEFVAESLLDDNPRQYSNISAHPSIRRDLALVLDESVTTAQIRDKVVEVLGDRLAEFTVFDVYRSKQLSEGKKSVAIGMKLQETSRTLLDSEATSSIESVVAELKNAFGAQLR